MWHNEMTEMIFTRNEMDINHAYWHKAVRRRQKPFLRINYSLVPGT